MVKKKISVRLGMEGGKKVKAELEGIGASGKRGFDKISTAAEIANARMARFVSRAQIAGRLMAVAAVAASVAMVRSSMRTIDEQAKLAASLETTTESIQVLARAGELAGVSMGEVEQATIQLTKRLSQAAGGTGPAVDALERLRITAADLEGLTVDQKVALIQESIERFVPAAERAAVASQLFGDRAGLIFSRIDSSTLRQATKDVHDFELAVSEADAEQIQRTNDALSRMALIAETIGNKVAVLLAPALEAMANKMAALVPYVDKAGKAISFLWEMSKLLLLPFRAMVGLIDLAIGGYDSLNTNAAKLPSTLEAVDSAQTALNAALGTFHETAAPTAGKNAIVLANDYVELARAAREAAEGQLANLEAAIAARTAQRDGLQGAWAGADMFGDDEIGQLEGDIPAAQNALAAATQRLEEARAAANRTAREVTGAIFEESTAAASAGETFEAVVRTVEKLNETMEDVPSVTGGAADAAVEAAETTQTAWQAAGDALATYAENARNVGQDVGAAVSGAFSSAENAIANFVETGKFDFKSLANSIIADLTRIAIKKSILGPLAEALDGLFDGGGSGGGLFSGLFGGGGGGASASVLHSGGMVGGFAPSRMMPSAAFAGAPRMHDGGFVGLRPDEVPAILQKGERVQSRAEVAAGGGQGGAVTVNIYARDAESFRGSQTQIAADIAQAVSFGQRGL